MNVENDPLPTRQSLLSRLKDCDDQESWKVFFDTYWRLIYNAAIKAGLTDSEAQEVVQETLISVMKSLPNLQYDPKKGSFKGWLRHTTQWRIADQIRKRRRQIESQRSGLTKPDESTSAETATIDRIPDPARPELEAIWDEEWERNLIEAAIDRVKKKVDPKQYQIFDLHVLKHWSVLKVAATLGVNPARVYFVKHQINQVLRKEITYLQSKIVQQPFPRPVT
jgi:RNA polymerase sigma factor (sigma-70 family)